MRTELTAAIPAVWPAVARCPVVQKEIAKISAVPINRHVTAFAIALRIGMLGFPIGPSPVDPPGSCAAHFSGVIAVNIEVPVVIVAEFLARFVELRQAGWTSHQAGPHTAQLLIILIDKTLSTIESNC
jgi:hypothetical protein